MVQVLLPLCKAGPGLPATAEAARMRGEDFREHSGGVCLIPKLQFFPLQAGVRS